MIKSVAALALAGAIALTTGGADDKAKPAVLGAVADGSDRTVQVFSYQQPWTSDGQRLEAGFEVALLDIEICMKKSTDSLEWNVDAIMGDDRRFGGMGGAPEPGLNVLIPLAKDACVRGKALIQVPIGQRPVRLVEDQSGATIDL